MAISDPQRPFASAILLLYKCSKKRSYCPVTCILDAMANQNVMLNISTPPVQPIKLEDGF